jgi:hypothetical protein
LRVVSLRNLSRDAIRTLLQVEQIPDEVLEQVMALTHGNPLALSLLIDAVRRSVTPHELPTALDEMPDLVRALLSRLVDQAPSNRHRAALQISAHAAVTTEPVLRAALPTSDPQDVSDLWDWLRDLTFMEESRAGIHPHDVVRDILEADVRWRDPMRTPTSIGGCAATWSTTFARKPVTRPHCNKRWQTCCSWYATTR